MADSRFFERQGPFSLPQIIEATDAELVGSTSVDAMLEDVAPLDQAGPAELSFLDNSKYVDSFSHSRAGACFARRKYAAMAPKGMILLIHDDPYRAYAMAAALFYPPLDQGRIAATAVIHESAEIGDNADIASGVVIGKGVKIGNNCRIGANTVISHALIGDNAIIHPNVSIGQDGFGFAMGRQGHVKVPQLGRVIIESNVEIGAGSCIDRGTGPDTIIGEGSKIDNLVQIAHNVQIGKHAVIVAQVGISGSSRIGDFSVLAGQAGVAGHITIGKGVKVAAKGGVISDIADGQTMGGIPAIPIRDWHKQTLTLKQMVQQSKKKNTGDSRD